MTPQGHAAESAPLAEVEPGGDVPPTMIDELIGRPESLLADLECLIAAAVVDAQDRRPVIEQRIAHTVEK